MLRVIDADKEALDYFIKDHLRDPERTMVFSVNIDRSSISMQLKYHVCSFESLKFMVKRLFKDVESSVEFTDLGLVLRGTIGEDLFLKWNVWNALEHPWNYR